MFQHHLTFFSLAEEKNNRENEYYSPYLPLVLHQYARKGDDKSKGSIWNMIELVM